MNQILRYVFTAGPVDHHEREYERIPRVKRSRGRSRDAGRKWWPRHAARDRRIGAGVRNLGSASRLAHIR